MGSLARLKATGNPSESWMKMNVLNTEGMGVNTARSRCPPLRRARGRGHDREGAADCQSARNELEFLKRVLAAGEEARGQRVDPANFDIPAVKHTAASRGEALGGLKRLYEFASGWSPPDVSRMILLAGRVGPRSAACGSTARTTCLI